jgi:hypothetical protein
MPGSARLLPFPVLNQAGTVISGNSTKAVQLTHYACVYRFSMGICLAGSLYKPSLSLSAPSDYMSRASSTGCE